MSTTPMGATATVTVELAEETLLALLGEKAGERTPRRTTPPPLPVQTPEGSPRLVKDLQNTPSLNLPSSILQSAQRPLFQPVTETQPEESELCSEEPANLLAFATEPREVIAEPASSTDGLVLYQAPSPRRAVWLAAAGVAIGLTGFAAYAYTATRQPNGLTVVSPAAENLAKFSPLKLQLESRDHSLVGIRWDPQSAPLSRADSGRLVILEDGSDPHVVPLDIEQLKIGHLYYDTLADRVEFRLEVTDKSGAVTKESLLALSPPNGSPVPTETANSGSPAAKPPVSRTSGSAPMQVLSKPTPERTEPTGTSKPSARQFAPPAGQRDAESLRAVYLDPPAENVSSPALSILAAMPTFNHFAPPPPAVVVPNTSPKLSETPLEKWTSANLLRQVPPVYPASARSARIEGTVRFTATVTKDGKVKNLQKLSGNPLLVPAASDAAKQWLYRPTLLNGHPVEALTQIAVDFTLN